MNRDRLPASGRAATSTDLRAPPRCGRCPEVRPNRSGGPDVRAGCRGPAPRGRIRRMRYFFVGVQGTNAIFAVITPPVSAMSVTVTPE
jgi:hypothetical protein